MPSFLAAIRSRPAFAAYGLLAGLFVAGVGVDSWRDRNPASSPPARVPILAEAPRHARDWQTVRIPPPPEIVALRPTSRDLEALAARFKLPDLIQSQPGGAEPEAQSSGFRLFKRDAATEAQPGDRIILNSFRIPKMPWGGEGLATLRPTGETDVHLIANPRPRFELRGQWGLGAMVGQDTDGNRWRAYGFVEPLRLGSVYLRGEAGAEGRSGSTGAYLLVGLEWRRR